MKPIYLIFAPLVFYWAFAASISVYRLWLGNRLNAWNEALFSPLLVAFFLTDVAINWTVLMVMGVPPAGTKTISERFEVYHKGDFGWRSKVATWVCETLLNTIDPSPEGHC